MDTPALGFIGVGRVGETLARLWHRRGFRIAAVYNRTSSRAAKLGVDTGAQVVHSAADVIRVSDLTVLAVADDALRLVVRALAAEHLTWTGRAIVHTSGALSAEVLNELRDQGAMIGSLHPAFPFADVTASLAHLPGAAFAIEADAPQLSIWLGQLIAAVEGLELRIPAGQKSRYHAALVMASNYVVTLYATADSLLAELGAPEDARRRALNALVKGAVHNLQMQPVPADALTGPLVRADVGTIAAHLRSLHHRPEVLDAYRTLARLTYPLLTARGTPLSEIEETLQQDEIHHANDNS